jgi:hypothetical protein
MVFGMLEIRHDGEESLAKGSANVAHKQVLDQVLDQRAPVAIDSTKSTEEPKLASIDTSTVVSKAVNRKNRDGGRNSRKLIPKDSLLAVDSPDIESPASQEAPKLISDAAPLKSAEAVALPAAEKAPAAIAPVFLMRNGI